ncbi:alpha/beta hydrolase [Aliirhizobium smilacinae]|uniref:Alpha/beta hydrolase n=1 Tax=Aliirhizobium smilacinae TaxID=1395944 RepID=A0A5C4XAH5_9HYPH|nr:alpha/beta hydrolase [Rhizobium smilacinae]TNM60495.1 alpha/beta hydrolase [Rhizobium smilacinae]
MTLFLNFRVSPIGGAIATTPAIQKSDTDFALSPIRPDIFRQQTAGHDILFVIHGYNNRQSDGVHALTRLEAVLNLPPSAVFIGILWPGDSYAGFISYPVEKPTANLTGKKLAAFCNRDLGQAASLSFASHSLGARVALETIRRLERETRSACLMAAAIERTCLEKEYADAFKKTGHIYVLASEKDLVLRLAFPFGNFFGHVLDPTSSPLSGALGFRGPPRAIGNTVQPWQINKALNYEHDEYLPPSGAEPEFPDPKGTWIEPASFIRRAFNLERQTWPLLGTG